MRIVLLLVAVVIIPGFATAQETTTVVTPPAISDVLINPGKGWLGYGHPGKAAPEVLALCAGGYTRFEWSQLNPEENVYDWTRIDNAIAEWKALGKPFSFGVMCLNTSTQLPGGYSTPKWVFDAGAPGWPIHIDAVKNPTAGTPGDKMVPDFANPIFQDKLRKFLNALAVRYDGSPDIAFIDVRVYGNWGEGHLSGVQKLNSDITEVSPEVLRGLLQIQRDAFHQTPLIVPWGETVYQPIYDWAVGQGMGLRRDGICGNSDGHETAPAFGKEPAVFEFYSDYAQLKAKGWWDGPPKNGYGHPLAGCVEKGMPSWIGLSGAKELVAEQRPLVEQLANRMGYHFILTRAEFPPTLKTGQAAPIRLDWHNDGVAPIYVPAAVALALLDDSGQPVETIWPSECHPANWPPDQDCREDVQALFAKAPPGHYRLALGLVEKAGASTPTIRLGIAGRTDTGWYPLGPVQVGS